MFRNKFWLTFVTLLVLCTGLNAGAAEIATLDVDQNGVLWTPTSDAAAYELVVSGPTGVFTQVFRGEHPTLSVFNAEGGTLVDGRYTWELRVIQESAVQFGYLTIVEGRFVTVGEEATSGPVSPMAEAYIVDDDSPTLRLEQNSSAGLQSQIWDIVGNETGFVVRDVTNGSKIPFRIAPNAPTSSLHVAPGGNVGLGTTTPDAKLHSIGSILVADTDDDQPVNQLIEIRSSTDNGARMRFNDGNRWHIGGGVGNTFFISDTGDAAELFLDGEGNLTITGSLTTASTTYPDYVFKDDYNLLSLDEVASFIEANGHLPNVPSETEVLANGSRVDISQLSHTLLEKVEELTLYTLQQHETIKELQAQVEALQGN